MHVWCTALLFPHRPTPPSPHLPRTSRTPHAILVAIVRLSRLAGQLEELVWVTKSSPSASAVVTKAEASSTSSDAAIQPRSSDADILPSLSRQCWGRGGGWFGKKKPTGTRRRGSVRDRQSLWQVGPTCQDGRKFWAETVLALILGRDNY
jgi:hypothetical protein